jgi:hypothetical protein
VSKRDLKNTGFSGVTKVTEGAKRGVNGLLALLAPPHLKFLKNTALIAEGGVAIEG